MNDLRADSRLVMTLDAGGTNFRFSAMCGGKPATETLVLPAQGADLDRCLACVIEGFRKVRSLCPAEPVALSFAFPGPADYPNGIIGDLPNLPGFRGGVALGPMLAEAFEVPVFINNDGDLFTYGEAIAGLLPWVNARLAESGSPKRFRNLFGVTLGTGFGGGLVQDGRLYCGDNSGAGEVWLLRNKLEPDMNAEEGASIRGVVRAYTDRAGVPMDGAPDPEEIYRIATGAATGHKAAAREAFRQLGEVVGDALGNVLSVVDALAVVGGGLSGAAALFMPALVQELNSSFTGPNGETLRRLSPQVFNLDEPRELRRFLRGEPRELTVPGSARKVQYDALPRLGVGLSRLGTSEAIALGAYAFALQALDAAAGK
jgi:glucokinase